MKNFFQKSRSFEDKILEGIRRRIINSHSSKSKINSDEINFGINFFVPKSELGAGKQYQPLIDVKSKIITLQIIDLRLRKTPVRAFVSIYELFEPMDFIDYAESLKVDILKADYSAELDTLVLEAKVAIKYHPEKDRAIYSFLEKRIKAGLVNRRDLLEIEWSELGDFWEYFRLHFVVSYLISRDRRTIEVIRSGVGASTLVELSQDKVLILTQDEENIKIKILSKPEKNEKSRKKILREDSKQKHSAQMAIISEPKLKYKSFILQKSGLNLPTTPYEIDLKACFFVHQGTLLLQSSRKFLLYDTKTCQLRKNLPYCKSLPINLENVLIDDNLMVNLETKFDRIEIFKIQVDKDKVKEVSFSLISTLTFENIDNFFSVEEIVSFKKIDDYNLESILKISIANQIHLSLSTYFYQLCVKLSEDPLGQEHRVVDYFWVQTIPCPQYSEYQVVKSEKFWSISVSSGAGYLSGCEIRQSVHDQFEIITYDANAPHLEDGYELKWSVMRGRNLFLLLFNQEEDTKVIQKYQLQKSTEGFVNTYPRLIKWKKIEGSTKVYFKTKVEDFYFICAKKARNDFLTIEVSNQNLDVLKKVKFSFAGKIELLNFLCESLFQIIISVPGDNSRKNLLVDWKQMKFVELVREDGEPFFSTLFFCCQSYLIGFSSTYSSYLDRNSDGIYITSVRVVN